MIQKKTLKAYKNPEFINSRKARTIRILSEYLEPEKIFEEMNVQHTIVFFGSARTKSKDKNNSKDTSYWVAEELAFKLAAWSKEIEMLNKGFYICTGGGPGIMEAANRGASRAKASTMGLNISLPFEQFSNRYITPDLNLEFHYFFMRKLWFLYHAKAVIVFPGGFGTLDELFETLTLIQTKKIKKGNIPILLYDKTYWEKLINFQMLVDLNMISPEDLDLLSFFSNPDEGFNYLKPRIEKLINEVNINLE